MEEPLLGCAKHFILQDVVEVISPNQRLAMTSRWKASVLSFPDKGIYQFTETVGMEGVVGLAEKSEPGILNRVHATTGASDCDTSLLY